MVEEPKLGESSSPDEGKPVKTPPPEGKSGKEWKLLGGALLAVLLVVSLYFVNRYWISPAVGNQAKGSGDHPKAPEFSLTDITGNPLKLSDFRGKVVMLDFWATWCGPCREEIPEIVKLQQHYGSQGFAVVGISMDDSSQSDEVVDYYKQLQMNYPVAIGNDRLSDLYGGVIGLPTTFMIGRDGRIYAKHVGATSVDIFEAEIKQLLADSAEARALNFHQVGQVYAGDKSGGRKL
jgi:thiol-disulfide isomerase/thioredoxin